MAAHTCPACGHAFSVPDWLDTGIKCPKCMAPVPKTGSGGNVVQPPTNRSADQASAAAQPGPVASTNPGVGTGSIPPSMGQAMSRNQLGKWLNDARVRSLIAGAIGGFAGWIVSELLIGGPTGLGQTLLVGAIVGLAIAATLGAAEGLVIRSLTLAKRGLMIGLVIGAIGGAFGAAFGQLTYAAAASPAAAASGNVDNGGSGSFIRPTFSREVAERIEREGGEVGEIEIALIWHNRNDLDLHVVDPNGEEIYYGHNRSVSGGWLDIDQNAGCGQTTEVPVEHVRWTADAVPEGTFRVYVNHFANCGPTDPTSFHVEVKNGNQVEPFEGSIRHGQSKQLVHSFSRRESIATPVTATFTQQGPGPMVLAGVIFGWLIFGVMVGCAEGITRRSSMAMRNAAIGGAIGGLLGGIALLLAAAIGSALVNSNAPSSLHAGWMGRMLGFLILGACIGLWIVLIERALTAILAVRSGQHEGRELFLDKKEMRIGRNDALKIYLGGDLEISDHHATIRQEGKSHVISEVGGRVLVNDSAQARCTLKDGDSVTLGQTRLLYRYRSSNSTS